MSRLNVYVDGFNLYFGMVQSGYQSCKWLDILALSSNLKNENHTLNKVKYFTSRIRSNPEKQKRLNIYLDALATTSISIVYGKYLDRAVKCRRCGTAWSEAKEKMTDVNIATSLLVDAFYDRFDEAILVTGDSDLVPPIKAIRELFPSKKVVVAFPPSRQSYELKKIASAHFVIGRRKLENSQLEERLVSKSGILLERPARWR